MTPSWFEHVDLMQVIIGALFALVIWFLIRTINKVDQNQSILFQRLTNLEQSFFELRGEHRAQHDRRATDK